jgi:hypothetical protein|tara:strand:- start:2142 stop:2318 length:177 start_codon:yes stop_codon:yes gene_type:complete
MAEIKIINSQETVQIINQEGTVLCQGKIYESQLIEDIFELLENLGYLVKTIKQKEKKI